MRHFRAYAPTPIRSEVVGPPPPAIHNETPTGDVAAIFKGFCRFGTILRQLYLKCPCRELALRYRNNFSIAPSHRLILVSFGYIN